MALAVEPLFNAMVREFHSNVADERFMDDFVFAFNLVLDEMTNGADLSSALTPITQINTTQSSLDADDARIMSPGLRVKLIQAGRRHMRGNDKYQTMLAEWNYALGEWMMKKQKEDGDDVDADGTDESVIGLGDVTDWEGA